MKTILTILCVVQFSSFVFSQYIPSIGAYNSVDTVCSWNDSIQFLTAIGWEAYQTIDDSFNGVVDSNYCISLKYDSTYAGLSFHIDEIDTTRSLFIKANINDSNKISLWPNYAFRLEVEFMNNLPDVSYSTSCPETFCSGVILSTQIPDSTYTSLTKRWYYFSAQEISDYYYLLCFPTEKFEEQYLSDFIYKITFNHAEILDTVKIWDGTYYQYILTNQYSDAFSSGGAFDIDGNFNMYPSGYDPILFVHNNTCYPSPACIDSVIITPIPNPDEPVNININVMYEFTILLQPFVDLVGAYSEGDTTRHTVSIVNDGGALCLGIGELPFSEGEEYMHKSGSLQFSSETGCMLFKNGSSLHVADNSTLEYGKYGIGAMGLMSGCKVILDKNSNLIIGNSVLLLGTEENKKPIYINLNEGSTLRFKTGSKLKRWNGYADEMLLVVYMNGGILDDSGLSEADKKLIRRIYPAQENKLEDKIFISPNPVNDIATLEIQSEIKTSATISLIDINGKLLKTSLHEIQAGITPVYFDMKNVAPGFYLFTIELNGEVVGKKILKL